jgi:ribosome-associated toxin RatA of RatAB toxin-antitoxin module
MPIVEAADTIEAPQAKVFAVTQDYYLRLKWDPFLRELKFLRGATEAAAGVQVWVKAKNSLTMTVEYRVVEPPGRVAMAMVSGPFFFELFAGTWQFEPKTATRTLVRFRYSFRTRWRLLRPVLDPLFRLVFLHDVKARLAGLKHFIEAPAAASN